MDRRRATALGRTLGDIGLGLAEVGMHLGRVIRRGSAIMASGSNKVLRRLPPPHKPVLILGSASLAVMAVALVLNIRFAEEVLPKGEVDLFSAGRPVGLTILDRQGRRLGTRGIEYDEDGNRSASLGISYREAVPLEDLPPYVTRAFIATEDRRFFEHPGFDVRGLARALVANVQAGRVVEGGSTISQQLAKNLFLSPEQTIMRKLEEMQLALWLEARLSKEDILSLYMNRIYLGAGTYGIEAAADAYFSKDARDLTLAEAAILAGLPKAPSTLAPTSNLTGAIERSAEVIDNLVEIGAIDPVTAEIAKLVPPDLAVRERNVSYGYFLDRVTEAIYDRFGTLHEDLIVTTTLDLDLQAFAQAAVEEGLDDDAHGRGAEQAALIAYDDRGGIVAMVGGRSYEQSQFNRASQAKRQPGSAFKPFVFLAALEAGFDPGTLIVDRPVRVGDWRPRNYANTYRGPVRLSDALASSVNSVAVQVTETIGRDRVVDAARRAGLNAPLEPVPSIALGAFEVSLEDLTAAYLPFAQEGAEVSGHVLAKVETRGGRTVYEYAPIEGFQVLDAGLARETTNMLARVMTNGTGRGGALPDRPSAGKTGTTNDFRDAWFVGYTPQITAGVWIGNDRNAAMDKVSGSSIPLQIWSRFMTQAHDGLPALDLPTREAEFNSTRQLAGLYAGLRSDLVRAAYLPTDGPGFGFRRPTTVVGRAAPGVGDGGL